MRADGQCVSRRRAFVWFSLANIVATLLLWRLYLVTIRAQVEALEPHWWSALVAGAIRVVVFVGPTVVAIWCNPHDSWRAYAGLFRRGTSGLIWGLSVGGVLVSGNAVAAWVLGRSWATCQTHLPHAWAAALGAAVFCEEFTYRGYFFRNLRAEAGPWVGYLGSAVVFVSIHIPGYLLVMHVPPLEIVQRSASIGGLALVLAFLLQKTGSIYAPLLVHAANNFAAVVFWT